MSPRLHILAIHTRRALLPDIRRVLPPIEIDILQVESVYVAREIAALTLAHAHQAKLHLLSYEEVVGMGTWGWRGEIGEGKDVPEDGQADVDEEVGAAA